MYNRLKQLFATSPVLMLTAALMLIDVLVCAVGLTTDHTVITGAPTWMKPMKFALSTGIYALSIVIIIRYTPIWKRTLRAVELLTGAALILEIVLIDLQAARHTTSHFNVAQEFDRNIFAAMGIGIGVLWISSIVLTVATFRTRYASPAWTTAIRYGMLLTVLGTGTGGFMTTPSPAQLDSARKTHHMTIAGSHTIGGVDGGKGLPVVGWSTQHGDVRVAHFAGLHGLQVLALFVFALDRRRVPARKALRLVCAALLSYGSFFFITLTEALRARPITSHDLVVTCVWIGWASLTVAAFLYAMRDRSSGHESLLPTATEAAA